MTLRMRPVPTLLLVLLGAFASLQGQTQAPTEFILRASPDLAEDIARRYRLTNVRVLDDDQQLFLAQSPSGSDDDELEDEVDDDPDVAGFEPNQAADLPETPQGGRLNESTAAILETLPDRTPIGYFGAQVWKGYAAQPAASILRLPAAHAFPVTGRDIVAIIDTGVDPNHFALRDVLVPGFDFTRNVAGPASEFPDLTESTAAILEQLRGGQVRGVTINESTAAILEESTAAILEGSGAAVPAAFGHGTMVAGLIHLVAPTARLMPLKAFRADGTSTLADIIRAIYFAADNGARVINMSFSVRQASDELMRAISYATSRGVICVSSAGNNGVEELLFAAGFRHVTGVGSTNNAGQRSLFSNHGQGIVRVHLPGEGLITSYPGGRYAAVWGTSFSGALAAGAAALLVDLKPEIVQERADQLLAHAQHDIPKALQTLATDTGSLPVPPPPPLASRPVLPGATLLLVDVDAIEKGTAPLFLTSAEVNAGQASLAARSALLGFQTRLGRTLTLRSGQVGDEGWFALKAVPTTWGSAGPTLDGARNFFGDPSTPFPYRVGSGLGTGGSPEALLDKIPGVTPLRARGLKMLVGTRVCAVVQNGDLSINYGPLNGSLKGTKLGTVAFNVLSIKASAASGSGILPEIQVQVLDPREVCRSLTLLTTAPVPTSTSVPFDTVP